MLKKNLQIGETIQEFEKPVYKLHLDPENPRLPEDAQGKSEAIILKTLLEDFDLLELADSITNNGYFREEPLIAVPKNLDDKFKGKTIEDLHSNSDYLSFISNSDTEFIVVEGNRRLAAVKILLDSGLREKLKVKGWPKIRKDFEDNLKNLPIIVYPDRKSVTPYLGVRHISGIKKWEAYAKAKYIVSMKKIGYTIEQIQEIVGDRGFAIKRTYTCYKLVELMEIEYDKIVKEARDNFSYLLLAIASGTVKEYLGIEKKWDKVNLERPVPKSKIKNLQNLFSFLFGDDNNSKVIQESRDITHKLIPVLRSDYATKILSETRNLDESYDLSEGEQEAILKKLRNVNRNLEYSLGKIHRNISDEIIIEIKKAVETLNRLLEVIKNKERESKKEKK